MSTGIVPDLDRRDNTLSPGQDQVSETDTSPIATTRIHLAMDDILRPVAEEKQKAGKGEDGSGGRGRKKNPVPKSGQGFQAGRVDAQIAKHAGVSKDTVHKVRTNEDKRRAVTMALELRPELSNVLIAQHCGVSDMTVHRIRSELQQSGGCPQPTTRIGQDGKRRKAPAKKAEPEEDTTSRRRRGRRKARTEGGNRSEDGYR